MSGSESSDSNDDIAAAEVDASDIKYVYLLPTDYNTFIISLYIILIQGFR